MLSGETITAAWGRGAAGPGLSDMAVGTGKAGLSDMAVGTGGAGRVNERMAVEGDPPVRAVGPGRGGIFVRTRGRGWLTLCAALGLACGEAGPATPGAGAPASAPVASAPVAEPAAAVPHPLLAWLDPDALSAVYTRAEPGLDLEALATLFAVPPRATRMLRDLRSFDDGLAALLEGVGPAPATWLRRESLAYLPPVAQGPYLVRGLTRPRAEVEGWLKAAGLAHETIEGMAVYAPMPPSDSGPNPADALPAHLAPAAAFPWRIVFLADDVIGCVSLREIGGGLGPLTAARDLPSSQIELNLTREFTEDPDMQLDLFATGPMLSLDISDDVGALRLGVRRWSRTGLDGELILQPVGDAEAAAKELEARKPALATEVVRELYQRVAFTPEPPVVRGRLQLTEADLRQLRVAEAG